MVGCAGSPQDPLWATPQVRQAAFKRGSAYLERYCLLLALAAYVESQALNTDDDDNCTFEVR